MPEKNDHEKLHSSTSPACSETRIEQGYGACTSPGCNCPGYTGSGDLCGNCGHNYTMH
ncbi:MAG TPA: hypothetical protein VGN90_11570 [Pyrinomonadaceae bacterium]|jgi:hypothetical protein|nr:hypothetical protein [Pyrinomonadaceae bacterium]